MIILYIAAMFTSLATIMMS